MTKVEGFMEKSDGEGHGKSLHALRRYTEALGLLPGRGGWGPEWSVKGLLRAVLSVAVAVFLWAVYPVVMVGECWYYSP